MAFEARELRVGRNGVPLLAGLSFAVRAGQALVLRGPNGIGKTSLLRSLAGLQPLMGGDLSEPADIWAYAAHADGVKGTLSVTENLAFWAQIHGNSVTDEVFAWFDLEQLRDRAASRLSAGQRRRLGLARLAVAGRRGLLLDEPTVSLDTNSVALFARFIERHLAGGGFAIIATHIDLGLNAQVLELEPYKAAPEATQDGFDAAFSDEAFL
ncbi:MAG: heme ABC exporter ATP-binding protein CcmA [Pseudomonadota bacterium]